MRKSAGLATFVVLVLMWVAVPVRAVEPVESKLVAKLVVVDKKGRETFKSAAKSKPNDVIEYATTYKNKGKTPVTDLTANLPIPVGMAYVVDSAFPKDVQASSNGQDYGPLPLLREIKTGKLVQRENSRPRSGEEAVPVVEYRFLQWHFAELKPKASKVVRARATIIAPTQ